MPPLLRCLPCKRKKQGVVIRIHAIKSGILRALLMECQVAVPICLDYLANCRTKRGSLVKKQIVFEKPAEFVF